VGKYTVEGFLTGNEQNYIDTATFNILDYSPYGPTLGVVNISYTFCINLPDNGECEPYHILWDFGDGQMTGWMGPYVGGETVCIEHSWSETGDYEIRVKIRDNCANEYWTDPLVIHISDNSPPSAPDIEGPPKNYRPICGKAGQEYEYKFRSEDPDDDNILYLVDWGDGTYDDWFGPYPSGEEATAKHTWNAQGCYTIMAKAKDIWGAESDWTTMSIPIEGNRAMYTLFLNFLQKYPNLFPILQLLLQRLGL